MAKHTPGPWCLSSESATIIKQDLRWIGSGAGVQIGSAAGYPNSGFFPTDEEAIANARLIAAAPELLAALRALLPMVAEWHAEFPRDVGDKEAPAILAAQTAIAKATGAA